MMQMLEPIHDALDSSQAAEDILFEHIRNIIHWKESIDSSLLQVQAAMNPMMITEKISEDAKSAISQHIMMFNKTMQEWQTKMSCDMMDMIQRGKIDTTGVSEELKRVWTQLSEGVNMHHKNTMELQSKFALVEAEKNQLREHVQQGSQERASTAQEVTNIKSKLDEFSKRFDIVHETYRGLSRQLSYHENVLNHRDKSGRPDIGEGLMQAITQLREEVNMLKSKSAADDREIGLLKRKVDMQNAAIQSQITCIEGLVASDLRHQECHADLSSHVKKKSSGT
jgi:chromosome segregation ATPase